MLTKLSTFHDQKIIQNRYHFFIVCSTTLWVGHLSKLVGDEELSDAFGEFGAIESINLIPPRGCAFICMNRRQDAAKALKDLNKQKLQGKPITVRLFAKSGQILKTFLNLKPNLGIL